MDADESLEFAIEGPLGKGMKFSSKSISGNNVILSGAIGVLPFYISIQNVTK